MLTRNPWQLNVYNTYICYVMLYFGINVKFYSEKSVVRIGNTVIQKLTSVRGTVCVCVCACDRWKNTGMQQKAEIPKVCEEERTEQLKQKQ